MEGISPATSTRVQQEASLVRAITLAAAAIAMVVTLAGPAAYAWLSWRAQQQDVSITARLHATFVTQALSQSSSDWHKDVLGLMEDELVPQPLPEHRQIVDLRDAVVTQAGGDATLADCPGQGAADYIRGAGGERGDIKVDVARGADHAARRPV